MLNLNLDKLNDILYLGFSDTSNSYGQEIANGIVILHDMITDEITGLTIFDFLKRYKNDALKTLPIPIMIDFENDICPKLRSNM